MNSTQARESRRTMLQDLLVALHAIARDGSYLRSIQACEAMAQAHQLVGRLQAIDEQESYSEAIAAGRPVRSPRPSIVESIDVLAEIAGRSPFAPLTDDQIDEAARRMALQTEPAMSDDVLEAMADAWDRGDQDAVQAIVGKVKLDRRGA